MWREDGKPSPARKEARRKIAYPNTCKTLKELVDYKVNVHTEPHGHDHNWRDGFRYAIVCMKNAMKKEAAAKKKSAKK